MWHSPQWGKLNNKFQWYYPYFFIINQITNGEYWFVQSGNKFWAALNRYHMIFAFNVHSVTEMKFFKHCHPIIYVLLDRTKIKSTFSFICVYCSVEEYRMVLSGNNIDSSTEFTTFLSAFSDFHWVIRRTQFLLKLLNILLKLLNKYKCDAKEWKDWKIDFETIKS